MAETNDTPNALTAEQIQQMQELADAQQQVDLTLAGLGEVAHDQAAHVIAGLETTNATEYVEQANEAVNDAQTAEAHLEYAHQHDLERAEALDRGDYEAARDASAEAAYHLELADAAGHDSYHEIVEAQSETSALDYAHTEDQIAHDDLATAASYAESGDMDHAATYTDMAAGHAAAATDHAYDGGGGTYETSYSTTHDTSTAADTTSE